MADNKKKRGGADRGLIALSEPYEVAYWSKKFKITPAKLKSAVKKADAPRRTSRPISSCRSTRPPTAHGSR